LEDIEKELRIREDALISKEEEVEKKEQEMHSRMKALDDRERELERKQREVEDRHRELSNSNRSSQPCPNCNSSQFRLSSSSGHTSISTSTSSNNSSASSTFPNSHQIKFAKVGLSKSASSSTNGSIFEPPEREVGEDVTFEDVENVRPEEEGEEELEEGDESVLTIDGTGGGEMVSVRKSFVPVKRGILEEWRYVSAFPLQNES
jgi:hypothetical protein